MEEVEVLEKIDDILFRNECCAECMLNEIIHVIVTYINKKAMRRFRK